MDPAPPPGPWGADAREGKAEATYQLVDAVDGAVVLVTEPLHAFEAERQGREAGRRGAQHTPQGPGGALGRDGSWTGGASRPEEAQSQDTKENRCGQQGWAQGRTEAVSGYAAASGGQGSQVKAKVNGAPGWC